MTDQEYMAQALPGPERRRVDQPQPHGGGCHRQGRPGHRPGLSRPVRRPPRRAGCPGRLHPGPRRGDDVRHARALRHQGRQPPCTEAILEAGIARVVVGSGDPNPKVAGERAGYPPAHGVQVTEHVLEAQCRALNEVFFHYIQTGKPYVVMKYAMTLDGKIAAYTGGLPVGDGGGGPPPRPTQRNRFRSILVGVDTVLADDPQLTCRIPGGRNPRADRLRHPPAHPLTAQVVATARPGAHLPGHLRHPAPAPGPYVEKGCQILSLPSAQGHVSLPALLERLGRWR